MKPRELLIGLLIIIAIFLGQKDAKAQVGIDERTPNPYAILEMTANDKGLLIPRLSTTQRVAMSSACGINCPDGLLVFDTDKQEFYYLFNNSWFYFNPFISPDATNNLTEDAQTRVQVDKMGINTAPGAAYKLDVNGNTYLDGTVEVNGKTTINSNGVSVVQGDLRLLNGGVTSSSDIESTNGHIRSNINVSGIQRFSSNINESNCSGPVPRNGIILWWGSPSAVPAGYRICNDVGGAPELNAHFVVGQDPSESSLEDVNDQGGQDFVLLETKHLPAHVHQVVGSTNTTGSHTHRQSERTFDVSGDGPMVNNPGTTVYTATAGSHSHAINFPTLDTGLNLTSLPKEEFDNRPRYKVLIFIQKI